MTRRVVHYLNQFFGQVGGEEFAHEPPSVREGPVGPGVLLDSLLGDDAEVFATVVVGDNHAADKPEETVDTVLRLIGPLEADLVVAGPAFNSGRYGVSCASVGTAVADQLGIPVVTGMYDENPGVDAASGIFVVRTGDRATGMRAAIQHMASLVLKLLAGDPVDPAADHYLPRGRVNVRDRRTAAERSVDMLLAKMADRPFETEIPHRVIQPIPMPSLLTDPSQARIALVTDGGIVEKGNPRHLPSGRSTTFSVIDIGGLESLTSDDVDVVHHGYDTTHTSANPNRLLPVDAARRLEREGVIGTLHEKAYSTAGVSTTITDARRIGRGIAREFVNDGVLAVILTST